MQNRKFIVILMALLLISMSFAQNWTLIGDYVSWENANAKINCTAYSKELSSQTQYCNFTYLGSGNPTINTSFVFNVADGAVPKKAYLWKNTSHVVYEPQNISVNHSIVVSGTVSTSTDPCDWGSCGIKRKLTDINGTTKTYCFSSFVNNSNTYTLFCSWNETQNAPVVRYWDDWEDVSSAFEVSQFGSYKVGTVQSSWTTGQSRLVRIDYSTTPNTDGKFDIYFHTGSAQEAKADPSKVKLVLDPWYNSSWQYRKEIQWNSTVSSALVNFTGYIVVDTSIPISQGKMKNDCSDLRIANATDALLYEIENNTCNTNFTTIFFSIPVTTASGNDTLYLYYGYSGATDAQNRNAVWRNAGYVGVWHFSEASGTIFDSLGYNDLEGYIRGTGSATYSVRSNLGYGIRCNSYSDTNQYMINKSNVVGLPQVAPNWTATWWMNKTSDTDFTDGASYWLLGNGVANQIIYNTMRTSGAGSTIRVGGYETVSATTAKYLPLNTFQHFALNSSDASGNSITVWKNGTLDNYYAGDVGAIGTGGFAICGSPYAANDWNNVTYTEFRFRNQSSSADWIAAEYAQAYFLKDEEANITAVKNISFISQTPSDLTSTNLFSLRLNITYNATYTNSTPYIFYKINSTSYDGLSFLNGTRIVGWQNKTCINQTVSSVSPVTWLCQVDDNKVYPATYNIDEDYLESAEKSNASLSLTSHALKMEFYNVSNSSAYSFFEIYAFNITPTVNPLRFFYCNSSYTTGNIGASANCVEFATLARTTAFNHTHSVASKHHVLPLGLNTTSGRIGTVKVSPTSYIIARGATNNGWNVSYISNISRITAYQTTTNLGTTWANLSGTADAHIHQFGDADTLYYFGSVAPSGETWSEANATNSTVRNDLIQLGGLPPSDPVIITPTNTTYYRNSNIMINYTSAISPNGYDISFYNISLLNTDLSFNQTIRTNNSLNLTFDWNISAIPFGQYVILVNATDNNSLSSLGFSEPFNISMVSYWVSPTPINGSNNFTYGMIYNLTSSELINRSYIEIDGTNYSCTLSADNKSCSYTLSYAEHIYNNTYDVVGYANLTGTYYQSNETRVVPYYGCGYVINNATLIGNVYSPTTCFTIGYPYIIFDGAGFNISGESGTSDYAVKCGQNFTTIKNTRINGTFVDSIYIANTTNIQDTPGIIIENNTIFGSAAYGINERIAHVIIRYNNISAGTDAINLNQAAGVNNISIYGNNLTPGQNGIWAQGTHSIQITNNTISGGSLRGILISNSPNSTVSNTTIFNQGTFGLQISNSNNSNASNLILYNNTGGDLDISGSASAESIVLTGIIIDNPRGGFLNYTNISLSDTFVGNEEYTIKWIANRSIMPAGYFSFANKYINITRQSAGYPTINTITFNWLDSELGTTYNESRFKLFKYNASGWYNLNYTSNTSANHLKVYNLDTFSDFGILELNFTAYFDDPTPANSTNISDTLVVLNISASSNIVSPCYFQINGTNYTGTLAGDSLSCYYNLYPTADGYTYNYTGFVNNSGTITQTNETMRHFTWYNDTNCVDFITVFSINQTNYSVVGDTYLYVISVLTLNNSCSVAINHYAYQINDSTADGTWNAYFVDLNANELKNFTDYEFRVPITFTDVGEINNQPPFDKVANHEYKLNTTYSRNIANLMVNLTGYSGSQTLYSCEASVCPYVVGNWYANLNYTMNGSRVLRDGNDTLSTVIRYVVSHDQQGNPSGGAGGGGNGFIPATPSETETSVPDQTIETEAEAQGVSGIMREGIPYFFQNMFCIPAGAFILLMVLVVFKRRSS